MDLGLLVEHTSFASTANENVFWYVVGCCLEGEAHSELFSRSSCSTLPPVGSEQCLAEGEDVGEGGEVAGPHQAGVVRAVHDWHEHEDQSKEDPQHHVVTHLQ